MTFNSVFYFLCFVPCYSKIINSVLKSQQTHPWAGFISEPNTTIAKTQKFVKPLDKEWQITITSIMGYYFFLLILINNGSVNNIC